jgi:hypothetical protein
MKKILFLMLLFFANISLVFAQSSTATYTVTFDSNWTQDAHPHLSGNLPSNAHWSKLVGATHTSEVNFLEMGQTATTGIENLAELGSNSAFFSEINTAISLDTAYALIDGSGLATAEGQIVLDNVITTSAFPLLTLASMIAPSPDWMIAINSISLLDGSGEWKNEITLDLFPYDAGSDNGIDYTSANSDTNPKEPITSLLGVAPFSSEKIGTLTITLEEVVLGVSGFEDNNTFTIYPNPISDQVTISSPSTTIKTIEIYNVIGFKILSMSEVNNLKTSIDATSFSSGIYLMRITDVFNRETIKRILKL